MWKAAQAIRSWTSAWFERAARWPVTTAARSRTSSANRKSKWRCWSIVSVPFILEILTSYQLRTSVPSFFSNFCWIFFTNLFSNLWSNFFTNFHQEPSPETSSLELPVASTRRTLHPKTPARKEFTTKFGRLFRSNWLWLIVNAVWLVCPQTGSFLLGV